MWEHSPCSLLCKQCSKCVSAACALLLIGQLALISHGEQNYMPLTAIGFMLATKAAGAARHLTSEQCLALHRPRSASWRAHTQSAERLHA